MLAKSQEQVQARPFVHTKRLAPRRSYFASSLVVEDEHAERSRPLGQGNYTSPEDMSKDENHMGESTPAQAITKLSKIEANSPILSNIDLASTTAIASHLLRVKNTAAQHGFLAFLVDANTKTS